MIIWLEGVQLQKPILRSASQKHLFHPPSRAGFYQQQLPRQKFEFKGFMKGMVSVSPRGVRKTAGGERPMELVFVGT